MPDLNKLTQSEVREAILLAEVVAWLHDYRKCSDEQLQIQSKNPPPNASGLPRNEIVQRFPQLQSANVSLINEGAQILDLLKWDHRQTRQQFQTIGQYLVRCHHTAHFDKQEPPKGEGEQDHRTVYLSSPFGYESDKTRAPTNLTSKLFSSIPWLKLTNFQAPDRDDFVEDLQKLFPVCGADTRRPINEITLWDWGYTVGSLYKAALAGARLGFQPQADDLRWRLLGIRFDGFSFFAQSFHLPDVLVRRKLLDDALEEVCHLLEVIYPLGTQIYRDENGSVFVVPGCEKGNCSLDLLALQDGTGTLHKHILDKVRTRLEGELVPTIQLDQVPWWGQDPDWAQKQKQNQPSADELPPIWDHLLPVPTSSDPNWVEQQWNRSDEICAVCDLRPQGPSPKAKDRNVCDTCEQRRADRSREWATIRLHTTIWTDEVANTNGRLALIVGHFDLTHWLSGDLVRTMAVRNPANAPNKTADAVAKNPSFARLRRIWETTSRFWQEVLPADENGDIAQSLIGQRIGQTRPRLEIRAALSEGDRRRLGNYHTYDLVLSSGVKLSVVWDPQNKRFITADNLDYLAGEGQLGRPVQEILKRRSTWRLEEPVGYGSTNKVRGTITLVQDVTEIPNSVYTPAISILAEPCTFMALVPAGRALEVVRAIKTKHAREMGKVRNRLPLHLGVVYAHRRTPLRAILDAGRRMLKQKAVDPIGEWRVVADAVKQAGPLPEEARQLTEGTHQFDAWYAVKLENQVLDRKLTWYVSAVMGDGATEDHWYPYVFLKTDAEPTDRNRRFQAPNPWTGQNDWLVHAGDLKEDDVVYFIPATLDFQWLDSAARRFEIAYEKDTGARRGLARRPYLLDEVDTLERIWQTLKHHLTQNQIYALRDLVEGKREQWGISGDESAFRQFCRDALANAEWRKGQDGDRREKCPWEAAGQGRDEWLNTWASYAARGWLVDAVELHLQIMKEEVAS